MTSLLDFTFPSLFAGLLKKKEKKKCLPNVPLHIWDGYYGLRDLSIQNGFMIFLVSCFFDALRNLWKVGNEEKSFWNSWGSYLSYYFNAVVYVLKFVLGTIFFLTELGRCLFFLIRGNYLKGYFIRGMSKYI